MNGQDFKALRLAHGMTQRAAAVLLDVTVTTVSRWETGKVPITAQRALWIGSRLKRHLT